MTLDRVDGAPTVTTSELHVTGRVPGIDNMQFMQAATDAGKNCPISRALAGVEISIEASLEDASYATACSIAPSDSISIRTTSPDCRNCGGSIAIPTPLGVPVRIRSPGRSVHVCAMKSTSS